MSKLTLQGGTAGSLVHRRIPFAAILIISGLVGLAAAWALPHVAAAAARWAATPPVKARTVALSGSLTVTPRTRQADALAAPDAAPVAPEAPASPAAGDDLAGGGPTEGSGRWRAAQASAAAGADEVAAGPPAGGTVVRIDPGARFDMLGVLVDGPAPRRGVVLWLRASSDGASWGDWYPLDLQPTGTTGGGPRASTDPVWVGEARLAEVAAEGRDGTALRGVRVMTIDTAGGDSAGDQVVAALRSAVAVVAAAVGTTRAEAMTTAPDIVTRAEWGADESWKAHDGPYYAPVKMAFVHHTVNKNGYTRAQAPRIMRGIYYYDVFGNHWSDFGYNFAVDRYGTVYEGRAGGVTKGVIGAHVLGFNTSSTGIAMIGTFSTVKPPAAMLGGLEKLLAWKLDVHHVDPQGTASMLCRTGQKFREGQTVSFPVIAGHRQANYTVCPGGVLYNQLPTVRKVAASTGLPKIYAFRVSSAVISPNADGVKEGTRLRSTNSASAAWTVRITNGAGAVVRTFEGEGEAVDVVWNGRDDGGTRLADGLYAVTDRAATADGQARAATASVTIDTVPPRASAVGTRPAVFSPNGDGYADKCHVLFTTSEACYARVLVVDENGAVLRLVSDWTYGPAGARDVVWNGKVDGADAAMPAPEGTVRFRIELKDLGGNPATASATAVIDRTLRAVVAVPKVFSPNGDGVKDAADLAFALTRKADVVVVVRDGDQAVRTFKLPALQAGAQATAWDGKASDGTTAPSGLYRWTVTATSVIGEVSAANWVTVDLYRPRLSATSGVTVSLGSRAKVRFTARDPYSPTVHVKATVRNAKGKLLATIDRGWVRQGVAATLSWRPPARRTYTLRLSAVDRGGNLQYSTTRTVITVR